VVLLNDCPFGVRHIIVLHLRSKYIEILFGQRVFEEMFSDSRAAYVGKLERPHVRGFSGSTFAEVLRDHIADE
jgi:hypothetical protein